jgi:hypothetical protein
MKHMDDDIQQMSEYEWKLFEEDFEAFVVMATSDLTYEQAILSIRTKEERDR